MPIDEQKRSEILKGLAHELTAEQVAEIEDVSVDEVKKIESEEKK